MQNTSDNPIVVFLVLLFLVGAVTVGYHLQISKAEEMLRHWASKQGMEIISAKYRPFGGPFWFKGRDQWVFEIVARAYQGGEQHGHAICGSLFLGLWSEQVDVKWSNR